MSGLHTRPAVHDAGGADAAAKNAPASTPLTIKNK